MPLSRDSYKKWFSLQFKLISLGNLKKSQDPKFEFDSQINKAKRNLKDYLWSWIKRNKRIELIERRKVLSNWNQKLSEKKIEQN